MEAILFILSGLPGVGKSTLAQLLVKKYGASYLRIDTVEQGLRDLCHWQVQGEGYRLSYRIASDNLRLGMSVVADSCNPILLTRKEWEEVARQSDGRFINIEIVCSDKEEHRQRVSQRPPDIERLKLPNWQEVQDREYHTWAGEVIRVDTAHRSVEESFEELIGKVDRKLKDG